MKRHTKWKKMREQCDYTKDCIPQRRLHNYTFLDTQITETPWTRIPPKHNISGHYRRWFANILLKLPIVPKIVDLIPHRFIFHLKLTMGCQHKIVFLSVFFGPPIFQFLIFK